MVQLEFCDSEEYCAFLLAGGNRILYRAGRLVSLGILEVDVQMMVFVISYLFCRASRMSQKKCFLESASGVLGG